jgi:hypothetical protein
MRCQKAERLAISGEEQKVEQEKAAKIAIVVDEWFSTVQDHTRRNLTHSGDILMALGALATGYHDKHGRLTGSYAASLWKGALLEDLM